MKRRTALRNIGLGLSAGMALPAWLSSCGDKDPGPEINYDGVVAIIGAGAAGLYVADVLQTKGIQVLLFEASDRLGGRIRSIRQFEENPLSNSNPIELGAERILGSDSLWSKMVTQLERPFIEFSTLTSDRFFVDGTYKTKAEIETDQDFIDATTFLNTTLKNYSGNNVSVQEAIVGAALNSRVHDILNSMIGNKYGTSNDRLSATALAEGLALITRNSNELRLTNNPMQDVLSSRFSNVVPNIRFAHVVKSVNYSGEKIVIQGQRTVSGATEEFTQEVDKVIVTVPVSVLKDGDITFTPALPSSKTTSLSRMEMDPALRVVLEFKQNFWGIDSAFIYGGPKVPEYFNIGAGETSGQFAKILSMTVMGQRAVDLAALGDGLVPAILDEMDVYFDGKATLNVRRDLEDLDKILSVKLNWTDEPYIRGGIAYVKPGGTNADRITLGEPVDDKLFFGGEATDGNGEFGTINGALLSAERVAQEVVDSIVA